MCGFPVDSDGNGVVTIPPDECVQEWELLIPEDTRLMIIAGNTAMTLTGKTRK